MVAEWTVPLAVFPALGSTDPKGIVTPGHWPRTLSILWVHIAPLPVLLLPPSSVKGYCTLSAQL